MKKQDSFRWLCRVTGKKKYYVALLALMQALNGGSGVLYALLLRNIVDSAVQGDAAGFQRAALLTVLLVAGQILLRTGIRQLEEQSRASLENVLKSRLLHEILTRDFAAVSAVHSGEWLNRLTNDCAVVANHFTEILPGLVGMAVKMISAAVMLIVLDGRFAAVMLPAGAVMLLMTFFFRRQLKVLHKRVQEQDGHLRIFLQERLGAQMLLRSFAAETVTESDAAERMEAHKAARMKRILFSNVCNIGFLVCMHGMYLFGICYCSYGILKRTIGYGTLTAVTQLIAQIQMPFANISGYLPRFYAMLASAERLRDAERLAGDGGGAARPLAEMRSVYGCMTALGLRGVSFSYLPAAETVSGESRERLPAVLRNISLEVKKGEFIALTGPSGCGKSTLLKLLMCVYRPDAGVCWLRDGSGRETVLGPEWHRLFAYVPQGNQLMSGSIRSVVAFADPDASDDETRLRAALRTACAEEFVGALEHGADTLLGERGAGLSEGQMQRIAIARAVFSDSPVLMLDEATSALDAQTEEAVLRNLRQMTDRTVLIVTHRPAALGICDRVFRFSEDGMTEITQKETEQEHGI